MGELPERVAQHCKHVAAGVPKWVLRAWNVSRDLQGLTSSCNDPPPGQRGPVATRTVRPTAGRVGRLTDPSLARSVKRPGAASHRPARGTALAFATISTKRLGCTHPRVSHTHRLPGSPASSRLGLSAPPGIRIGLTQRASARLGAEAGFIAREDSSRTSAFRQASGPSPSPPAGGERRLLILPVG